MFHPAKFRDAVLRICRQREARGDMVFEVVRGLSQIQGLPQGTVFIAPDYPLWPGREVPDVQAVMTEPVLIATDDSDMYMACASYGSLGVALDGVENYADENLFASEAAYSCQRDGDHYVVVIPDLDFYALDCRVAMTARSPVDPPKQKPGRKLEFL